MLLVLSPHLDDAVLSASALVAGADECIVATAFTAAPAPATRLTEWDAASGFRSTAGVMAVRLAEDRAALEVLGVKGLGLGELDGHYGPDAGRPARLGAALAALVGELRPRRCAIPLGVVHPDHVEVRTEALRVARHVEGIEWLAYSDLPYSHALPGAEDDAFAEVCAAGWEVVACRPVISPMRDAKRAALACYPSQLRALAAYFPSASPAEDDEHYWRITAR